MTKKKFGIFVVCFLLTGCANTYFFEGRKFDSKESFQSAVASYNNEGLAPISPLPVPVTTRKLLFALPSEATFLEATLRHHATQFGGQPNSNQIELYQNLVKSNVTQAKALFDAIKKRNIYTSVQFVEMQSTNGEFAPSTDTDTLFYVEPTHGSGQYFYSSAKYGKQIFAFDRSAPGAAGKMKAFLDAVQIQAIRD